MSDWTKENLMLLNANKSNYMIVTRAAGPGFSTRLNLQGSNLQRLSSAKLLGVWISDSLDWELNTNETCKETYMRVSMLNKLKYIGMKRDDLVLIYKTYIRCVLEYCCVVWSSSLTAGQKDSLERVQKVCVKVILGNLHWLSGCPRNL